MVIGVLWHENVAKEKNIALENARAELLTKRVRIAGLIGVTVYPFHSFGDWTAFHDPVTVKIRLATTVVLGCIFGLCFSRWAVRRQLALVTTAFLVAIGGFQAIICYKHAFDTMYANAFDQFYATFCVLIPATTAQTAAVGLGAIAISTLPQVYMTGGVAEGTLIALSYATDFAIFLIGRHIANRLWESQFLAKQESETYYARLVQSEKMVALGRLAAGIAHELNNPVAIISSNVVSIERSAKQLSSGLTAELAAGTGAQLSRAVERLRLGITRLCSVNEQLRQYVSPPRQEVRAVDVRELLDIAVSLVESKAHQKGITIHREGTATASLTCDPQSLSHVFVNLLDNSCDATRPQGNIWLRLICQPNGSVQIEVADDGSGFPESLMERLGEPFVTTKEAGKGIGLGLAVSKLIVEKNSGKLDLANRHPGAVATVTFPASLCRANSST